MKKHKGRNVLQLFCELRKDKSLQKSNDVIHACTCTCILVHIYCVCKCLHLNTHPTTIVYTLVCVHTHKPIQYAHTHTVVYYAMSCKEMNKIVCTHTPRITRLTLIDIAVVRTVVVAMTITFTLTKFEQSVLPYSTSSSSSSTSTKPNSSLPEKNSHPYPSQHPHHHPGDLCAQQCPRQPSCHRSVALYSL